MCLNVKENAIKRIALRNIKVYKFLIKNRDKLRTPYWEAEIKIGETYKSKLIKFHEDVDEGLHSFTNLLSLKEMMSNYLNIYSRYDLVMVECVIPRFSRYYKGKFSGRNSIASNRLKYVKIVE